ncbi:MAG: class I SAM-dependent methyltransferase [Anaerolineales bacterium]
MDHRDHVNLLRGAVVSAGGTWADLGSGRGAFTLALAELIGPNGMIFSVDKDKRSLQEQSLALNARFPRVKVQGIRGDFTLPLDLPPLDGIVIANALHFIAPPQKPEVVQLLKSYLRPRGSFVLVEYNVDQGNLWVPYPLTYTSWKTLAQQCGFTHTRLLATVSSRMLKEFYSAESW